MRSFYLQEMCFIQFVETNQFMSILCCMVAFYIPVSIMSGLYIRVWWETVKRQRDLVHLQAGKKASSKRSDSSEEVDPVRHGENPDVAWNRLSNGNVSHLDLDHKCWGLQMVGEGSSTSTLCPPSASSSFWSLLNAR